MRMLREYLPVLVLIVWALAVNVDIKGDVVTTLALTFLAVAVAVHTAEIVKR